MDSVFSRFKSQGSTLGRSFKPYTISHQNNNVPLEYELYAVVVHIGFSSTSGHYFSFVRSAPDTWHKLDDSKVDDTAQLLAIIVLHIAKNIG
ncbi:hypothetical protein S245_011709, partial [Arachis hypogaea]